MDQPTDMQPELQFAFQPLPNGEGFFMIYQATGPAAIGASADSEAYR
jgi:hypothetical protein